MGPEASALHLVRVFQPSVVEEQPVRERHDQPAGIAVGSLYEEPDGIGGGRCSGFRQATRPSATPTWYRVERLGERSGGKGRRGITNDQGERRREIQPRGVAGGGGNAARSGRGVRVSSVRSNVQSARPTGQAHGLEAS